MRISDWSSDGCSSDLGLIEHKVVVITGAGSGVGRAAALLFAEHGARLVLGDIRKADAEAVAAQVQAAGGEALARSCDVSRESDVNDLVQAAEIGRASCWGRVCQ